MPVCVRVWAARWGPVVMAVRPRGMALLIWAAAGLHTMHVVLGDYTCGMLPDQQTEHIFETQLVAGDDSSLFTGNMSYRCNYTTGGVTYYQNLRFSFKNPADPNASMVVSASASRASAAAATPCDLRCKAHAARAACRPVDVGI